MLQDTSAGGADASECMFNVVWFIYVRVCYSCLISQGVSSTGAGNDYDNNNNNNPAADSARCGSTAAAASDCNCPIVLHFNRVLALKFGIFSKDYLPPVPIVTTTTRRPPVTQPVVVPSQVRCLLIEHENVYRTAGLTGELYTVFSKSMFSLQAV